MSAPRIPIEDRFWNKVEKGDGCWTWVGAKTPKGYGCLNASGSRAKVMAHRVAYELAVGPIPDGLVIDHLCHNKSCVRPEHLRATTNKRNGENRKGANRNNLTGVRGVTWHKRDRRWHVRVTHLGVTRHGGSFDDLAEAEAAAVALRADLFGSAA